MIAPLTPDQRAVLVALCRVPGAEAWRVAGEAGLDFGLTHRALEALAGRGLARRRELGWAPTLVGRAEADRGDWSEAAQ